MRRTDRLFKCISMKSYCLLASLFMLVLQLSLHKFDCFQHSLFAGLGCDMERRTGHHNAFPHVKINTFNRGSPLVHSHSSFQSERCPSVMKTTVQVHQTTSNLSAKLVKFSVKGSWITTLALRRPLNTLTGKPTSSSACTVGMGFKCLYKGHLIERDVRLCQEVTQYKKVGDVCRVYGNLDLRYDHCSCMEPSFYSAY